MVDYFKNFRYFKHYEKEYFTKLYGEDPWQHMLFLNDDELKKICKEANEYGRRYKLKRILK